MEKFSLTTCSSCSETIDKHRAHLGYTECLDCSDVEAYSAHTVYPHKTGAYVQPVSKTASNNLKRIDRRSTGKTRAAKGIYSDKSWDRWLDNYYENLYNPKPERVFVDTPSTIKHLDYDTLFKDIVLYYKDNGYQHTMSYLKELYAKDEISMTHKAKITDELNGWEVMPKRIRKWAMKID